jgi:serine protease Do
MPIFPLSLRSPANRLAYAALALVLGLLATVAPTPVVAQGLPDFTELVEKVGPAVVNIRTTERGRTARGGSGNEQDDEMAELFRRFFGQPGRPNPRGPQQPPDGEPQQRGVGSGFILNADGYVMTNAHVVDGADEVIVTLADKREFKAKMIGADKRSDVALVKIEASGLPTVRLGDVSKLKVGEWVIAIGSPFGLESTVTAGIVSAKSRDTGDLLPLIQTDVAINPGNSGGPLINMRGEVVGINSQIYSRSGGYMGISFAIPIDEATRVSEQLRVGGRVIRGRIGVVIARRIDRPRQTGGRAGAVGRSRRPCRESGRRAGRCDHQGRRPHGGNVGRIAAHRRQHQAGKQGDAAGLPARQQP